jgi:probable HAF family extracellular repeat protein
MALGLTAAVSGPAQAEVGYDFVMFDVPGATDTAVNVNSGGLIAGDYDFGVSGCPSLNLAACPEHGFVLAHGVLTTIDVSGAFSTTVNGIVESGALAGTYADSAGGIHGFFLNNGAFTQLDVGAVHTQVGSLNARLEVVGSWRDATMNQTRHGFTWRSGSYTTFDVPGAATGTMDKPGGTVPIGINDHGDVVGDYVDAVLGLRHGFLKRGDHYTTFDPPGSSRTVAEGINDRGQIVGMFLDSDGNQHGFVLDDGVYTTLDVFGGSNTVVNSIDATGQIVGAYTDTAGHTHGFIGTPRH